MPPQLPEIGLREVTRAGGEELLEVVDVRKPLPRCDRDRRARCDPSHLLEVLRGARLLEPQRVVLLEPLREPARHRRRDLTVRADQDVGAVADRFADRLDRPLRAVVLLHRDLPGADRKDAGERVVERIELHRR